MGCTCWARGAQARARARSGAEGNLLQRLAEDVEGLRNQVANWVVEDAGEGAVVDVEAVRPPPNHGEPYDVVIVGAWASGVGMGLMLSRTFDLDPKRVLIVERGEEAGESFRRWPKEMRFISPSFNLNSVAFETSPAYSLGAEHPTGAEYAKYLDGLATQGELNIQYSTQVTAVRPDHTGFSVDVAPARPD